jgi:enoyl-CoA hydratase/carnithine racemase
MKPGDFEHIRLEVGDGVGTLSLNRPDRRNAWSGPMAVEYRWALHHCHTNPDVRVVVLTGAGNDFCVGAETRLLDDIDAKAGKYSPERSELPPYPANSPTDLHHNHLYPLLISTPIIAAIEGACAGAGFVLATYTDLRFASRSAKISSSFARLGLPAEYGIGWTLARTVGVANAAQLLYSAAPLNGTAAAALGWVQRVFEAGEAVSGAVELARVLARESSGESLRTMKRQVFLDSMGDLHTAYVRSVEDMNAALRHPDLRKGLDALRERRPPNFLV